MRDSERKKYRNLCVCVLVLFLVLSMNSVYLSFWLVDWLVGFGMWVFFFFFLYCGVWWVLFLEEIL